MGSSVVGFDVGGLASKIGLARNRGVDIITNEVSNRATPSLVAFGPRNRSLGESAKTQESSNFKNTIGSLKRLVGRTAADPEITEVEAKFSNADLVDAKGTVGVKVHYLGEQQVFSATQLYAAYLGRLRDIASVELKNTVNDCVIAVPGWYTDVQRRAVLDAAEIANLHPLRLINETTATALGYGITKTDLPAPEEKPRNVAFIDIGHTQYQVAIVSFVKGALQVKGYAYDHHFGGRDLDFALVRHFAEEFKGKYKIDVLGNKKAIFRLATATERLKKVLSANAQAPLNVESIMNDIDASSSLTREAFEELIAGLLDRTLVPLEQALAQAGLSKDDIDAVELVGGTTRVPALKTRIQNFFNKPLSFTCNQEEAIARGATLACATLSPIFRVRDFAITDIVNYPIEVEWVPTPDDPQSKLQVFPPTAPCPSGKLLTFYKSEPFEVEARYSDPSVLPGGINPFIGRYVVKGVQPTANGEGSQIKVKARMSPSGTFLFDGAQIYEEVEGAPEEAAAAPPADGADAMETDGAAEAAPKPAKRKVVKKDLQARFLSTSLDKSIVNDLLAKEGEMHASDKLVAETEDKKNALEEYVYDTRDKLDGVYAPFVTADVKEKFKASLQEAEDWLYSEEGEDATKSQYVAKLDELLKVGGPIKTRQREQDLRPKAERELREAISMYMEKVNAREEKYSHLTDADWNKVVEKCAGAEKWIGDLSAKQAERPKSADPAMTSAEIMKRRENLVYDCTPIFNKPKPKAPAPDVNATKKEEPQAQPEPTPEADMAEANGEEMPELEVDGEKGAMDVD